MSAEPGPRSDSRPMAFTTWEFIRGALFTYLYWLLLYFPAVALGQIIGAARDASEAAAGVMSGSYTAPGRGTVEFGDFWTNAYWAVVDAPAIGIALSGITGLASAVAFLTYAWALALLVGILLRRTTSQWVHLVAHACVGVLVGFVTPALALYLIVGPSMYGGSSLPFVLEFGLPFMVALGATTGIAALLGWRTTSSLALRRDRMARKRDASDADRG